MQIALTALTQAGPFDVVLLADDGATIRQVAEALHTNLRGGRQASAADGRVVLTADGLPTLWSNGDQVSPAAPAVEALRDGMVVTTDPALAPATNSSEPTGIAELRVISGPRAGSVHRIPAGETIIGSGPGCHVRIQAPGVPGVAGTLTVPLADSEQPTFEPATATGPDGSARATSLLEGSPAVETRPWPIGGVLRTGSVVLTLMRPEPPDAYLSQVGGGLAFNRPPRLQPANAPLRVEVPIKPRRDAQNVTAVLSIVLPLILGGTMVILTGQWTFALFLLLGPIMMFAQLLGNRGQKKRPKGSYRKRKRAYRAKMATLPGRLEAARVEHERRMRELNLDPAQILLTAIGPRRRLWERRADDEDVLRMRVGTIDVPARIQLVKDAAEGETDSTTDDQMPQVPTAFAVPVAIPLARLGVIGLAGPLNSSRALARWFVAQAAVMHSPSDLSIVVLTSDQKAGAQWNWSRWLPHNRPKGNEDCVSLVGTDLTSAAQRVSELVDEVNARRLRGSDARRPTFGRAPAGMGGHDPSQEPIASSELGPKILVVLDGARELRRIPGMPQILAAGRQVGVYAICIDETHRVLPEECAAVLSWNMPGAGAAANVRSDGVHYGQGGWAVSPHDARPAAAPVAVRMHGSGLDRVPPVLVDQVTIAWAVRVARALAPVRDISKDDARSLVPTSARFLDLIHMPDPAPELILQAWQQYGRTTRLPLGVDADGVFRLDLSADGPHGLVAGTTGAGKSELLQTMIAGLAVLNRPDSMNFVLIDYKGGSAFKDCARLPHTVGMVSDLDGHLTVRALDSLGAELKRREEQLLHAGAKDIEDYWDTKRVRPDLPPMPRLTIIIDEFAAMVAELPDFVDGLIDIARRGRSLGVHLILATQRPAGVVSADIRANTNLRIALRVTSADESEDVIDARDAAEISKSTPGRCCVRSGAASPVAVQSARVGGRRPGAGPATARAQILRMPWRNLGAPLASPSTGGQEGDVDLATDLSVLTDAIIGANDRAGYGEQRRPWLEPLPHVVTLDALPEPGPSKADVPAVAFGLTDVPRRQGREPLTLDFADAQHIVIAGAAHTGRSTLLRTLAGSVARTTSPADVHLYGLDCGTGALLPVARLPHCGAVVPRDQPDRVERLLDNLRAEIQRRQQLLADEGFTSLVEQRAATSGTKLPWMVLLLDWWEGFIAAFEDYDFGRLVEDLLQLLREGAAVGLRAVVTTDRAAMLGQPGQIFGRRLLLRLSDPDDAAHADISTRALPTSQPAGRLMFAAEPNPLEAQIALLSPDPAGLAQARALGEIAEEARRRYAEPPVDFRPLRVDPLPTRLTLAETWQLRADFRPPSPMWALAGAGGDHLGPVGLDIGDDGPGIVVAGPPRSGRSTTLAVMARSLIRAQTPILVICPRRSPLRALEGEPGVLGVRGADFEVEELRSMLNPLERYVVIVDDAEMLHDAPNAAVLDRIIVTGRDADHGLILAGATNDLGRAYTGFIPTALKSRSGVLVAVETPNDGDIFGVKLPRNARSGPQGRGLLVRTGRTQPIQIPRDE